MSPQAKGLFKKRAEAASLSQAASAPPGHQTPRLFFSIDESVAWGGYFFLSALDKALRLLS